MSTGVTGLTAVLNPGTLNSGSGNLVFSITGTAQGTGDATFSVNFGGKSCEFKLNIELPGAVASINCSAGTLTGTAKAGETLTGVTYNATYTGGNGGSYSSLSVPSSGVSGLIATIEAGVLANGDGNVTFKITGNPTNGGTAFFNFTFAGSTCSFSIPVLAPSATVTGLTCGSAVFNPGQAYYAAPINGTVTLPYTGGNGGVYSTQTITSTGVRGLTLTLQAGTLANGNGMLQFTISGTPTITGSTGDYAIFPLVFGGQQCSNLQIKVGSNPGNLPAPPLGAGTFTGRTCFDVVEQEISPECGTLTARAGSKADFSQAATYQQTYIFKPKAGVSNVRFEIVDSNGIIESYSGGASGTNITSEVVLTVNYKQNLNGRAAGLSRINALRATIYVIFNTSATGVGGNDVQYSLTPGVQDCICCPGYLSVGGADNGRDLCFYKVDAVSSTATSGYDQIKSGCYEAKPAFIETQYKNIGIWRMPSVQELRRIQPVAFSLSQQPNSSGDTQNLIPAWYATPNANEYALYTYTGFSPSNGNTILINKNNISRTRCVTEF